MALSKFVVTFNSVPAIDTILNVSSLFPGAPGAINLTETFKTLRTGAGISQLLDSLETDVIASFYVDAFNLDYNNTSLYTVTILSNVVTIEATVDNIVFTEVTNTTSGAVTVVITNEVVAPAFTIDAVTFITATTNPVCTHVKVQVDTSELATKVTSPVVIDPNVINPFFFEWVRGDNINITCENVSADSDTENVTTPQTLSASNITVNILNSPSGATVTIDVSNVTGLTLTYSLDDITFQSSNLFSGLAEGNFTIFVQDQLGCKVSTPFTIDEFSPDISVSVAEFSIEKAMSIRFKEDVVWGNCSDYKTEENTLSCEANVLLPYRTVQQFQTCDTITTQFKSNYATISANVIKSDGTKDALTIIKKSSNLDRKDKRDANFFNLSNGQTGIHFTTGQTYDFDTGLPIGTFALNGLLPDWGIIGNFVFLEVALAWFTIIDVIFDDDLNADVLVVDFVYTGIPDITIASSNYNVENFEIYEFDIDFSVYDTQMIQVEILNVDTTFDNVRTLSEVIEVEVRFEDTIEIIYWNTTNTEVFYATGIRNKIRVEFENFRAGIDPETEILKTDTNTILLNSQMYETNTLILSPVTEGIMRQITQGFMHKEVFLNGVKYILSEVPEVEPFGQTNLSTITAIFIKDGKVFSSELDGVGTQIEGTTELIGLLASDEDFIKT